MAEEPRTEAKSSDRPERGASLVEYALLLALIAVVCIGAVTFLGTSLDSSYSESNSVIFEGS